MSLSHLKQLGFIRNRLLSKRLRMNLYLLLSVSFFTLLLGGCVNPPYYSRFTDIDTDGWTRMATVEFSPFEEDSTYSAPKVPASAVLILRHVSGRHHILPLEVSYQQGDDAPTVDTLMIEIGNSRHIRKNGGYGLEVTQITILKDKHIADDFRLSVSPVDSVVGIHSIGLSIIPNSSLLNLKPF